MLWSKSSLRFVRYAWADQILVSFPMGPAFGECFLPPPQVLWSCGFMAPSHFRNRDGTGPCLVSYLRWWLWCLQMGNWLYASLVEWADIWKVFEEWKSLCNCGQYFYHVYIHIYIFLNIYKYNIYIFKITLIFSLWFFPFPVLKFSCCCFYVTHTGTLRLLHPDCMACATSMCLGAPSWEADVVSALVQGLRFLPTSSPQEYILLFPVIS